MRTKQEVAEHVREELDAMFVRLADRYALKHGDEDPMASYRWEQETVPGVIDYVWHWYEGNYEAPASVIIAVLEVEGGGEMLDVALAGVAGVRRVLSVEAGAEDACPHGRSDGHCEPCAEAYEKEHDLEGHLEEDAIKPSAKAITDAFFDDREPGTVTEREYEMVQAEVENSANYLRNESVWRVEYNVAWGQTERVTWVEASSEEDARGDETTLPYSGAWFQNGAQVRILSCRRATVEEDLEEFFEGVAREVLPR